jgi:hypothetical protein
MDEPIAADGRVPALPTWAAERSTSSLPEVVSTQEFDVELYDNEVPLFAEAALVSLYQNAFSCLIKFRIDAGNEALSVAVMYREGNVSDVFVFRREGARLTVMNQAIRVDEDVLRRFCNAAYKAYPAVSVISFHGIETGVPAPGYPFQHFNCLENIVLALPPTPEAYLASLGKNMRASIKRYAKKLAAELPSLRFEVYLDELASASHIREIVCLSSARMAAKHKRSLHGDEQTTQLIRLVQSGGLLLVASIDDKVCAGVVCSRVGENYFMHVVAHNPAYDELRLGKLSCYRAICECIDRGGKEFHFLWGRYEYKYRLLGIQRELDHVAIFRNHASMLAHANLVVKNAVKGYGRLGKRWLFDPARHGTAVGRLAEFLRRILSPG